jgi:hypothetical protein
VSRLEDQGVKNLHLKTGGGARSSQHQRRAAPRIAEDREPRSLSEQSTGPSNFETNGNFQAPFEQDNCPRRAIWILLFRHFDYSDRLLEVDICAQNAGVPWEKLQYLHPYSTAVAKGDEFVGRREKVASLASKILRTPMEPFFVTGQKRIGKTSSGPTASWRSPRC